jgi:hypothetical protein
MTEGRGRGSDVEAQVRAAFAPYLKFRAALLRAGRACRWEPHRRASAAYEDLWARQDEIEAALIVALAKIWREWKGTSPRTVGTDTSKLGPGKFPFGEWVVDLFKAKAAGENPPSRYAIQKAIKLKKQGSASLNQRAEPYKLRKTSVNLPRDAWARLRELHGGAEGAAKVIRKMISDYIDRAIRSRRRQRY